jgi:rSAM/selenodomain-associated transferase 2
MSVSVIIPARHEGPIIQRAVNRAWALGPREVIVVDGESSDDTARRAQAAGAIVVFSSPGRARQQNAGAARAVGDVLLFLHADTWLAGDALAQIGRALTDPSRVGGAFRQRIASASRAYRWLEKGNAYRVARWGLPYGDQGIFVRRGVFAEMGGFPEVGLMEDLLLWKRLRTVARPVLLPGPLHVSPRRWRRHGLVRQTVRNWVLLAALRLGVHPDRLARFYAAR